MSKSVLKRIVIAIGAILVIGVVSVVALIYVLSEWQLRRSHEAPTVPLKTTRPVDLAEGERMAIIVGCWAGCHGPRGEGGTSIGVEGVVLHTAPTLSDAVRRYSDEELARLVRYGVKRDGRSALGMISYTFWPLSDQDLANIFAHLRSQPAIPPARHGSEISLLGRLALVLGKWKVSAAEVDRTIPRWGELPRRNSFERGRYLASITCSECHGLDFRGNPLERGPSLIVVARYTLEEFRHLLRTGEPIGGRDLGIMSRTARNAFSRFNDQEISDIYTFLRTHHRLPGRQ